MTAKGSTAWYRRNDGFDHEADLLKRRTAARLNGMFDEYSERPAFEAWFRDSRRDRGAAFLARAFDCHQDGSYADDSLARHWHTWQMAVGAGKLLPKFDPIKIAANRIATQSRETAS